MRTDISFRLNDFSGKILPVQPSYEDFAEEVLRDLQRRPLIEASIKHQAISNEKGGYRHLHLMTGASQSYPEEPELLTFMPLRICSEPAS